MSLKCRYLNVTICESRGSTLSSAPAHTPHRRASSSYTDRSSCKVSLSVRLSEDNKMSKKSVKILHTNLKKKAPYWSHSDVCGRTDRHHNAPSRFPQSFAEQPEQVSE